MKKVLTPQGWNEITTKEIVVTLKDLTPFQTCGGWVDFCKRHPDMKKDGRDHCQCCMVTWESLPPETQTYFVQTTKGNRFLCGPCFERIDAPTVTSTRNYSKATA